MAERVLVFVGGVTGSGKSTFCSHAAEGWVHLVASQLISAQIPSRRPKRLQDKLLATGAEESSTFQSLLLQALEHEHAGMIVLDGHYVVPTASGLERVPLWFFTALKPQALYLVEASPSTINERLAGRRTFSEYPDDAKTAQAIYEERLWAQLVAQHLCLTLHHIDGERPPTTWAPSF
jgi:adenylate kinase